MNTDKLRLNINKGTLYAIVLLLTMYIVYLWRSNYSEREMIMSGNTMGTTYSVKYIAKDEVVKKTQIDSLLLTFNLVFSTYIPDSEISIFNQTGAIKMKSPWFYTCLQKSKEVFELSNGAFDPTVGPLVNAWGFGFCKMKQEIDSSLIDSLKSYVNFNFIRFTNDSLIAVKRGVVLDLSAISKGYGVDVVGDFLVQNGIHNFMVEIGGEVLCKGKNMQGKPWNIGIENPEASNKAIKIIPLDNVAMATSGNYKNYYEKDGRKYAHTIHPATGYPAQSDILSASVVAPDCMTADALATACMVLGIERSEKMIRQMENIQAIFVYADEKGELKLYEVK